jgi:hypothetical protein
MGLQGNPPSQAADYTDPRLPRPIRTTYIPFYSACETNCATRTSFVGGAQECWRGSGMPSVCRAPQTAKKATISSLDDA